MTKLKELNKLGQSIWYDNIRRALIDSGELQNLLNDGVRGITSNPSIFEKAITGSTDYDQDLHRLVDEGKSTEEIYTALVLEDIGRAADMLRPIYDESGGLDGYVSLEVSPTLANDTEGTINEARRLFAALGRPNVMIKVPATQAGIPAIEALISEGINVNVTLIFSIKHYLNAAEAYISGLEKFSASGGGLSKVASVASFFVSRVDSAVDRALSEAGETDLQGKIAIANAKLAYARFKGIFSGARWDKLAAQGARVQRPLWASTSTKNPAYPDTLYVDSLIGPNTVNTVPPSTLNAFRDHGNVSATLEAGLAQASIDVKRLADLGIDLDAITEELQEVGVKKFAQSFESLLSSIAEKRDHLLAGWEHQSASLGDYEVVVDMALDMLADQKILPRIWKHDYTVWANEPKEITNRLGWLQSPEIMPENIERLEALVQAAQADGYTHALLLGMGGSSLAPQVFRKTFGVKAGYLDLAVLDSTAPGAILAIEEGLDLTKTLFIVATKSGGTVETLSFFKYFYNRVMEAVGKDQAGAHFIAITDPGSKLVDLAERYEFRDTFLNDPNIGGRYSALSFFGLVAAALIGVDLHKLLGRAHAAASGCDLCVTVRDNPGAHLGATMGELAKAGRDKITIIASPPIKSFGDWVEQLIAESTGKSGRGILPVVGEDIGEPGAYGNDRLFVYLRLDDDATYDAAVASLEEAGQPVVSLHLHDVYDLGGQFFLWEMATAIAGYLIGIQPFDQPNVEAAKVLARKMAAEYQEKGVLPQQTPLLTEAGLTVYGDVQANSVKEALSAFLNQASTGDYIALQAYVRPDVQTSDALTTLRDALRSRTGLATTVGYGPRFLHSTGQLHKGDGGNGLFIQFTADTPDDAAIPDEAGRAESAMSFGVLLAAQAMGDRQALLDVGRRVIRFHLGGDVTGGLKKLAGMLA